MNKKPETHFVCDERDDLHNASTSHTQVQISQQSNLKTFIPRFHHTHSMGCNPQEMRSRPFIPTQKSFRSQSLPQTIDRVFVKGPTRATIGTGDGRFCEMKQSISLPWCGDGVWKGEEKSLTIVHPRQSLSSPENQIPHVNFPTLSPLPFSFVFPHSPIMSHSQYPPAASPNTHKSPKPNYSPDKSNNYSRSDIHSVRKTFWRNYKKEVGRMNPVKSRPPKPRSSVIRIHA